MQFFQLSRTHLQRHTHIPGRALGEAKQIRLSLHQSDEVIHRFGGGATQSLKTIPLRQPRGRDRGRPPLQRLEPAAKCFGLQFGQHVLQTDSFFSSRRLQGGSDRVECGFSLFDQFLPGGHTVRKTLGHQLFDQPRDLRACVVCFLTLRSIGGAHGRLLLGHGRCATQQSAHTRRQGQQGRRSWHRHGRRHDPR